MEHIAADLTPEADVLRRAALLRELRLPPLEAGEYAPTLCGEWTVKDLVIHLLVRERQRICLVGNHDLGVLGRLDLDDFAPDAAVAARWTQTVLLDENRAYLEGLSPEGTVEGAELYHASPRDPVWDYILTADAA